VPAKPKTPTEQELRELPRLARVAFAARCARRVQALFNASWPGASEKHLPALDKAITLAERADAAAARSAVYAAVRAAYASAKGAADDAVKACDADAYDAEAYDAAAYAVASADAVCLADAACLAYAAAYAADAAGKSAADATNAANAAMRRDYALLNEAAKREGWSDETPVPPEFFGPLWAEGVPEGWPVEEEGSAQRELEFEIDVPEDASDEDVCRFAIDLADRADSLHRAYGGRGLKVKSVEVLDEAHVREGVPA